MYSWQEVWPEGQAVAIVESLSGDPLRSRGLQHTRLPCPSLSLTLSLLKFMSLQLVMLSNYLILCCPLSFCPQSSPASRSFTVSQLFPSGARRRWQYVYRGRTPVFLLIGCLPLTQNVKANDYFKIPKQFYEGSTMTSSSQMKTLKFREWNGLLRGTHILGIRSWLESTSSYSISYSASSYSIFLLYSFSTLSVSV